MPILASSDKCYGCGACSNICPKKCIEMRINEYGELRPVVNLDSCVDCGKCAKVCVGLNEPSLSKPLDVYAMAICDENHKKGCASGGAARLLYEEALANGAVIAAFTVDFTAQKQFIIRRLITWNTHTFFISIFTVNHFCI